MSLTCSIQQWLPRVTGISPAPPPRHGWTGSLRNGAVELQNAIYLQAARCSRRAARHVFPPALGTGRATRGLCCCRTKWRPEWGARQAGLRAVRGSSEDAWEAVGDRVLRKEGLGNGNPGADPRKQRSFRREGELKRGLQRVKPLRGGASSRSSADGLGRPL